MKKENRKNIRAFFNKRKASISIAFALMVCMILAFALVMYDFNRLSNSRESTERVLIKAMDCALVEYDEGIYKNYSLMGVSNNENPEKIIEEKFDISLNENSGNMNSRHFKIDNISVSKGASLAEEKAIKREIIRSHEKEFASSTLIEWIKKIDILKMIPEYSKAIETYTNSIQILADLKDDYDEASELSERVDAKYSGANGIDIAGTVNDIIDTREEIEDVHEQMSQMTEYDEGLAEYLESLYDRLDELEDDIKKVRNFNKELHNLSPMCKTFSRNLVKKTKKIKNKSKDIDRNKEESLESVGQNLDLIIAKAEQACNKSNIIAKELMIVSEKTEEVVSKMNKALSEEKRIYQSLSLPISDYDLIATDSALLAIFGGRSENDSAAFKSILDFVWRQISGDYLPDFSELKNIDTDKFNDLPSQNEGLDYKNPEAKKRKPIFRTNVAQGSLKNYENHSLFSAKNDTGSLSHRLVQKLIIADYAVNYFTNVNSSEEDLSKSVIKAEAEYILSGNPSSKKNALITQAKIYSLRMVLNGISISLHKSNEISAISSTISASTAFIGYPIIYGIIFVGWSAIESAEDIKALNKGEDIPILKMKTEIKTNFTNMLESAARDKFEEDIKKRINPEINEEVEDIDTDIDKNPLTMNYKDHIMLFLLIESETETLLRISDIICINQNLNTKDFYTTFKADVSIKIPILFSGAKKYFTNSKGSKSYDYEITRVRGY